MSLKSCLPTCTDYANIPDCPYRCIDSDRHVAYSGVSAYAVASKFERGKEGWGWGGFNPIEFISIAEW